MNPILLDFEKLFATIKNDKNNLSHLPSIWKMIELFEKKYKKKYFVSSKLFVVYLKIQYRLLEKNLHYFGDHKKV